MSDHTPRHLILGATGGIGAALCRRLSEQGAKLVIASKSQDKVNKLASELGVTGHAIDATDPDQVSKLVEDAASELGGLDGAANLVGSILLKPAHSTSPQEFQQTLELNLHSAFYLLRACAKAMTKGGGSIVLMSSAIARHGYAAHEAIAAAKAGIIGMALAAAASYAPRAIRINCVAPGLTDTPLASGITKNEAALKASLAMHADGRIGTPDDVARAIQFFLDPANSHITGQVLAVDGGLGSVRAK